MIVGKRSVIGLILVCVVAVIGLRLYYNKVAKDSAYFVQSIQERFNTELKKLNEDEEKVFSKLSDTYNFSFQELNNLTTHYPYFLFKSGQPVYWSGHRTIPDIRKLTNEGWQYVEVNQGKYLYHIYQSKENNVQLVFVLPLFEYYDISNQYIKSNYNCAFPESEAFSIYGNAVKNASAVYNNQDEPLFYLLPEDDFVNQVVWLHSSILFFELLLIVLIIYVAWIVLRKLALQQNSTVASLLFLGLIAFIRLIGLFFDFPFHSEEYALFNPKYFASSPLNPSFGDLLINIVFLLLGVSFIKTVLNDRIKYNELSKNQLLAIFIQLFQYLALLALYGFVEIIYRHSQWQMDITGSLDLNVFKLLSILAFALLGIVFFLVTNLCTKRALKVFKSTKSFLVNQAVTALLFLGLCIWIKAPYAVVIVTCFVMNLLLFRWRLYVAFKQLSFLSFIYLFIVAAAISVTTSWSVNYMEKRAEFIYKSSLASQLLNDNDVLAEYLISEIDQRIKEDRFISNRFLLPFTSIEVIRDKIREYYLGEYFEKYDVQISIYDASGKNLSSKNGFSLTEFRQKFITESSRVSAGVDLYLVNNSNAEIRNKYIYLVPVKAYGLQLANISIELIPKRVLPDNVYPELLVDNRFVESTVDIPYDYGLYVADTLIYSSGKYNFAATLPESISASKSAYSRKGVKNNGKRYHLVEGQNEKSILFASDDHVINRLFSNFSFYFIVNFFLIFLWSVVYAIYSMVEGSALNLSSKIQLYFSLAFLIPLIAVSIGTVSFVHSTFLSNIASEYKEKAARVGERLTPILAQYFDDAINKEELNSELIASTKVTNADINLYSLNGRLLVSSQPSIFEKNLLSHYINPKAYEALTIDHEKYVTLEEQIGSLEYQSSFMGIKSFETGELIALLSSPFFKSNSDYEANLIQLLTNVFNIFVSSFIIFLLLAYAATRVLTSPLRLLKEKLSSVNLSEKNEPLSWKVDDEIGLLVREYNDMLVKLEKSREALSKTEKESAWREMAQQVAHEIKNPLTPMKLSLQHLQRRMTGTELGDSVSESMKALLSQVDNLSDIATSFSAFAKMPIPNNEQFNITSMLKEVCSLFKSQHKELSWDLPDQDLFAWGDPKLMERIFNNIIINASQSGINNEEVSIKVRLQSSEDRLVVEIEDNGAGIPEDIRQKVFLPNFSTKYTGSGIGLAIAKRGIEHAGGKIWFESVIDKGTTFYIELKRLN